MTLKISRVHGNFLGFGRRFRSRSADRDRQTDETRRNTILRALENQRWAAHREREGLKQRLDAAYASASALLDNSDAYASRSAAEEEEIRMFENSAASAASRITALDAEIGKFDKLIAELRAE